MPLPAYTQAVQAPVLPSPAVLNTADCRFGAVPHVPVDTLPACAVSEFAASVACVTLYVLSAVQS